MSRLGVGERLAVDVGHAPRDAGSVAGLVGAVRELERGVQ
jgi:hypothetical protein